MGAHLGNRAENSGTVAPAGEADQLAVNGDRCPVIAGLPRRHVRRDDARFGASELEDTATETGGAPLCAERLSKAARVWADAVDPETAKLAVGTTLAGSNLITA